MRQLLRLLLLQCALVLGLATAPVLLAATPALEATAVKHCPDCPQPAQHHTAGCCLQMQGCGGCIDLVQQQSAFNIPASVQAKFAEPGLQRDNPVFAPQKPPPRRFPDS